MITGSVGSIDAGVNPSCDAKWPSWKIQTMAPNDAEIDSRFMTTALSGRTTDPSRRNSTSIVATTMYASAAGVWLAMKSTVSGAMAVKPVTEGGASAGGGQGGTRTHTSRVSATW